MGAKRGDDRPPPARFPSLFPGGGVLWCCCCLVALAAGLAGGQDGSSSSRPPRLRAFWSPRSEPPPPPSPYVTASIQRVELSTEVVGVAVGRDGGVRPPSPPLGGPPSSRLPTAATTTTPAAPARPARGDRSVGVPAIVVPANNASRGRASASRGWVRREAWALPLLCVSGVCLVCMGSFEVWVLWEWRRRPLASSRRHLFLGQALLIGLLASTALAGVVSLVPTPATCGAVRLGAGLAPALVFSALLVKCVFLLSLNGGVYLPAPYQASLLLFAVLVQAAIGIQWLVQHPPAVLQVLPKPLPSISPLASERHGLFRLDTFNASSKYREGLPPSSTQNPSELFAAFRTPSPAPPQFRPDDEASQPRRASSGGQRLVVGVDTMVNGDSWEGAMAGGERARVVESGRGPPKNIRLHPKRGEESSAPNHDEDPFPACSAPYPHLLLSLCYVACLAVAVSAASARCRRVRENRRESLYICAASLLSLPVSLAWALAGLALPPRHRDAALAAGLLATSAAVFAVMFLPRGRRMAAVGRTAAPGGMSMTAGGMAVPRYGRGLTLDDDDDCDDDDDGSLSRAPSALYGARYSPSFFHFKPGGGGSGKAHPPVGDGTCPSHVYKLPPSLIPSVFGGLYMKPDEGNVYTTLEPTLSSNPNVFFHRGGLTSGMMY
ncbi:uncharacterized protein LOC124166613 isoform X2 [Ischnura elegans]|uniref:uncharacterized protein LOC124166613 isoform X2 n=1 Tax=Ischnura elegans TaxID=197161 RepID=UPI001ED87BD4|nr:uncharacterized protein LOC124166613 isoform X2 [Ischnura elegans]